MKQESGRSLIEVIGVMAIAGLMTVSALGVYNMLRKISRVQLRMQNWNKSPRTQKCYWKCAVRTKVCRSII